LAYSTETGRICPDCIQPVALAKQLIAACGTVKDGVIEVQGDHVVVLMAALQKRGYVVRRVGG
jgi:translation initiation factor 1